MSTVIIGGGSGVRNAVTAMENASLNWNAAQRANAEKALKEAKDVIETYTANPQPA